MDEMKEKHKKLANEKEQLVQKLNESKTASDRKASKLTDLEKRANEVDELRVQLKRKDNEIKKLLDEKHALEHDLQHTSKTSAPEHSKEHNVRSVLSSPMGSVDSLRKRDSICSVGSVKETPICRKANMAIVNRWQCLVEQVKNHDPLTARRESRSSLSNVLAKSRHIHHAHAHKQIEQSSQQQQQQQEASTSGGQQQQQQKLHPEDASSSVMGESDERSGRAGAKSPVPSALKPGDSRRSSAKSPSRSPVPTPKSPAQILAAAKSSRPAWRI